MKRCREHKKSKDVGGWWSSRNYHKAMGRKVWALESDRPELCLSFHVPTMTIGNLISLNPISSPVKCGMGDDYSLTGCCED